MARSKTPDEQIEALEADRLRIAVEKDAVTHVLRDAREVLAKDGPRSVTNREREALQAQARGRDHEPLGEIARDAEAARAAILANQMKVEALDGAVREIGDEIRDIEAEHLEFFAKRAHAVSIEALGAQEAARQALTAAFEAYRRADGAWGRVRTGRRRLDWPDLPGVPLTDLSSVLSGFETATRQVPWPGGRRPLKDEQLKAAYREVDWPVRWDAGVEKKAPEPQSNAEAIRHFTGEAA